MTEQEALEKSKLRKLWIALGDNPAFREYETHIEQAFDDHETGMSDRNKTPAERAEHIEAYHLTKRLRKMREDTIATLTEEVRAWEREQSVSPLGLLDDK